MYYMQEKIELFLNEILNLNLIDPSISIVHSSTVVIVFQYTKPL